MNMTVLKPLMVTACCVARYFNREESKPERVKQAILDVELILKQLGIRDPSAHPAEPAGK